MGTQRPGPLRGVPLAAPAGAHRIDILLGTLAKRNRLRRLEPLSLASGTPMLDRVDAFETLFAAGQRLLAGLCQGYCMQRPQAHDMQHAGLFEPEDPALAAAFGDLQEKAAA